MYSHIQGNPYQNVHASISPVVSSSHSQSNNSNTSSTNYNGSNNNGEHESASNLNPNATNHLSSAYVSLPK
jgi:hypothetical protein